VKFADASFMKNPALSVRRRKQPRSGRADIPVKLWSKSLGLLIAAVKTAAIFVIAEYFRGLDVIYY